MSQQAPPPAYDSKRQDISAAGNVYENSAFTNSEPATINVSQTPAQVTQIRGPAGFNATVIAQPRVDLSVIPNSSNANYGEFPTRVVCAFCGQTTTTRVTSESSNQAMISCCVLCICGCWLCAPIPFCMDSCKQHVHTCDNCGQKLGADKS